MKRTAIAFEATREGYSVSQAESSRTLTVGDLKALLRRFPDETLFMLSHDNGYTYGTIDTWEDTHFFVENDGEFEEVDEDEMIEAAYEDDDEEYDDEE